MDSKSALKEITSVLDKAVRANYLFGKDKTDILEAIDRASDGKDARRRVLDILSGTGIPSAYVKMYFESKIGPLLDAVDYA